MYNIVYNIYYLYVKYDVHKCVYVYTVYVCVCYMFGVTVRYDGRALIRFCEAESIQRIRSS